MVLESDSEIKTRFLESQKVVIACMLKHPDSVWMCLQAVSPECFSDPTYALIFKSFAELYIANEPPSMGAVTDHLYQLNKPSIASLLPSLVKHAEENNLVYFLESSLSILQHESTRYQLQHHLVEEAVHLREGKPVVEICDRLLGHLQSHKERVPLTLLSAQRQKLEHRRSVPLTPISPSLQTWANDLKGGWVAGDYILLTGNSGGGKSLLAGQIALHNASARHLVIYLLNEMEVPEVYARLVGSLMFRLCPERHLYSIAYDDIIRGLERPLDTGPFDINYLWNQANDRLQQLECNFFIHKLPVGASLADVRQRLFQAYRSYPRADPSSSVYDPSIATIIIIDPVQRLFGAPSSHLPARTLESINANDLERGGLVAQQVKEFASQHECVILGVSDTKKMDRANTDSSEGARGHMYFQQLATHVYGIYGVTKQERINKLLEEKDITNTERFQMEAVQPDWFKDLPEQFLSRFGHRYAFLDCSKTRNGPRSTALFTCLPGIPIYADRFYNLQ